MSEPSPIGKSQSDFWKVSVMGSGLEDESVGRGGSKKAGIIQSQVMKT